MTSDRDLTDAVALTEEQTHRSVIGAYMQSFGVTRSLPALAGVLGGKWAVLESPGPRPGIPVTAMMEARRRAMLGVFERGCRGRSCRVQIEQNLLTAASAATDGATGREIALGLVAAATTPKANGRLIAAVHNDLMAGALTENNAKQLKLLGRLYEGKRPGSVISPAMIALWADTCPRLSGWPTLSSSTDPIIAAFAWVFRGCALDWNRSAINLGSSDLSSVELLVLSGQDDTVVPSSIQATWKFADSNVKRVAGTGHFWEDGTTVTDTRRWIEARSK